MQESIRIMSVYFICILHEMRMDAKWDKTLDESTDALAQLAADALDRHERGETEPLDIERLA